MIAWPVSLALIGIWIYINTLQFAGCYLAVRRLRRDANAGGYSTVPLIFGAIGCFGFAVSPLRLLNDYWWIPILYDPITLMLVSVVTVLPFRYFRTRRL